MTIAATEIKLIKMGQRALQMDDATYRQMLANLASGKTSAKALNAFERQRVITHLKRCGFVIKAKSGERAQDEGLRTESLMRKLRAMWYRLADAGAVEQPADMPACNAAIETWAKARLDKPTAPFSALRFATGAQLSELVEQMKAWGRRVGAEID